MKSKKRLGKRICKYGVGAFAGFLAASTPLLQVHATGAEGENFPITDGSQNDGFLDFEYEIESLTEQGVENEILRGNFLPTAYDARNKGVITSVKQQTPFGSCWSFSSMAAMESSLISQKKAQNNLDLSESFFIYKTFNLLPDPLGGTSNDSVEVSVDFADYMNLGGNIKVDYLALVDAYGVTNEANGRYPTNKEEAYAIKQKFDAKLPPKVAYLKDMERINIKDRDAIKAEIMNHGAASSAMHYNERFLDSTTNAYFIGSKMSNNHAITIVGWDDNYDVSNFTIQPENNGAWLVKNSWGETFGDNGYMWISYEEPNLDDCTFLISDLGDTYEHIYMYDGVFLSTTASSMDKVANVFTVPKQNREEVISAVSISFASVDVDYSVQLYALQDGYWDPTDGTALLDEPLIGHMDYSGYYTIELPRPVILQPGTKFSVVFTFPNKGVKVDMEQTASWGSNLRFNAGCDYEQSYCYTGGIWNDCAGTRGSGNLRIRAMGNTGNVAAGKLPFNDVIEGQWYYDSVKYVYDNEIMRGYSDYVFDPNGVMTRSQMAQVLYSCSGSPDVKFKNKFGDVTEDKWYAKAVIWAAKQGITQGIGGGLFGPDQSITREQFFRMLYFYGVGIGKIQREEGAENANYTDDSVTRFVDWEETSDWAREATHFFVNKGVINGKNTDNGLKLDSKAGLTRAEAARLVYCFSTME